MRGSSLIPHLKKSTAGDAGKHRNSPETMKLALFESLSSAHDSMS
jgi:hypothetical protein